MPGRHIFPYYLGFLLAFSGGVFGQECTDKWEYYFDTDPLRPKVVSGDTVAGYAIYSFAGDPHTKLEIKGDFADGRFMSYESHQTRLSINTDHLFDFEIEPDAGSTNPFREGASTTVAPRAYTITATQHKVEGDKNVVALPSGRLVNVLMYRFYAPNKQRALTQKDLPRIFAYDEANGNSVACPAPRSYPVRWHFPQILANIYSALKPLEFSLPSTKMAGLNKSAGYQYATDRMEADKVILARFRAPSYINTEAPLFSNNADVRYWSFCTNNFPNNATLNCVPDYLAKPDATGMVYIAVGTGGDTKATAEKLGYSFLPDAREPRQKTIGFVYRNILPNETFAKDHMYQGDYGAEAKACSKADFIAEQCRW